MRIHSKVRKIEEWDAVERLYLWAQEVTFLGTWVEVNDLADWCTENNIKFKIKRSIFNTEIRFICTDTQLTHITLRFL